MAKTPTSTPAEQAPEASSGPGVVSSGWLAAESTFGQTDDRKFGPAMTSSLVLHGAFFLLAIFAITSGTQAVIQPPPPIKYDVVFLEQPGPGGGGGGSPAPAPPTPIEIPETPPPEPTPVEVEPVVVPPREIPVLNAPIRTNAAEVMQATGLSSVSLASYAGGGRGGGIGEGVGDGVGPGEGGGFGGGAFQIGNGTTAPGLLKQQEPKYTPEAMRAKVQGTVEVEVVIQPNGSVGEARIAKSLDRTFGLDQEALTAARGWLFSPCKRQGQPVACIAILELAFRIH